MLFGELVFECRHFLGTVFCRCLMQVVEEFLSLFLSVPLGNLTYWFTEDIYCYVTYIVALLFRGTAFGSSKGLYGTKYELI